ncbi:MAG: Ig-like domain-containing protein, partial [SAR202 cluster bacterium]|nr:Ig-like domain-containing protein [SAR202 cluster bacterium]
LFGPGRNYNGLLDNLVAINQALSDTEIQAVMNEAPVLALHLDEGLLEDDDPVSAAIETSAFVDSGPFGNTAVCTPATELVEGNCPTAGANGQMREAAIFDGTDSLTVPDDPSLDMGAHFSVSMWVKPSRVKNSDQILIERSDPGDSSGKNNNFSLKMLANSTQLEFSFHEAGFTFYPGVIPSCANSAETLLSAGGLIENQWNHVVATFNVESLYFQWMALYINGHQDSQQDTLSLGACTDGNQTTVLGENFDGRLDEVNVYDSLLTDSEILGIYEYQVSWYDIANEYPIIIDADAPDVSIDLDSEYLPNGETLVTITATDPTTRVEEVQVTFIQPSGAFSTQLATPSAGDIGSRGAWMYTIVPTEGEGQYTIQATATDSVGNQAPVPPTTFTVDDTPPTVGLDSGLVGSVQQVTDSLVLGGAISDSGSEVDAASVSATLIDPLGAGQTEFATSDGNVWEAAFSFSSPPYGEYSVQVDAKDNVSNSVTDPARTVGAVQLDGRGPTGDVSLTSGIVTDDSAVISGVVSDTPMPVESKRLHLRFEDSVGGSAFDGSSRNHIVATCADCPTAGFAGQNGNAVSFDGAGDHLRIEDIGVDEPDGFTAMAWVSVSDLSALRPILEQEDGATDGQVWLGLIPGQNRLYSTISGLVHSGSAVLTVGTWHHTAVTYNGEDVTLYLDGVQVGNRAVQLEPTDADLIVGANKNFTEFFDGLIDDVVIYDRALDAETLYGIANPLDTGIADAQIRFRHARDADQSENDGTWVNLSLDSPGANYSTWQIPIPSGLEGPYKIDLKATDRVGNGS